jgi:hypothetical protein
MTQHIDIELRHRIETGALKIGKDWTGYFIRGDNAIYLCQAIEKLIRAVENGLDARSYGLDIEMLKDFVNELRKV